MSRVALIGLGRMGLPICHRLLNAGHTVLATDLDPRRVELAARAGALAAPSAPHTLERADVVLTVLPGTPELRELMLGADGDGQGLLRRLGPDAIWIDLTSTSPKLAAELDAAPTTVRWLAAPMGGRPPAARPGADGGTSGNAASDSIPGADPSTSAAVSRLTSSIVAITPPAGA